MNNESLNIVIDDTKNPPVFYKPQEVLWLQTWLNRAAIAIVLITIVSGVVGFPAVYRLFAPPAQSDTAWNLGAIILTSILTIVGVAFQSIFGYYTLKALGSVLRILMEMEFNARDTK